jgi:hypothetical protein
VFTCKALPPFGPATTIVVSVAPIGLPSMTRNC